MPCTTASSDGLGLRRRIPGAYTSTGMALVHAADDVVAVVEDASGAGADAARDDDLRLDHLVVDLPDDFDVALVHAAGDQEDVGVLGVAVLMMPKRSTS